MNFMSSSSGGYAAVPFDLRTDRSIEAEILSSINLRLTRNEFNFPALTEALQKNRELWTCLAVAVSSEANSLPADLRGKIFYLYEVVRDQTDKVLRGEAKVGLIVDLNTSVIAGLSAAGED